MPTPTVEASTTESRLHRTLAPRTVYRRARGTSAGTFQDVEESKSADCTTSRERGQHGSLRVARAPAPRESYVSQASARVVALLAGLKGIVALSGVGADVTYGGHRQQVGRW